MQNIFVFILVALLALMTQQTLVEDQFGNLHHYRGSAGKWGGRAMGGLNNGLGLAGAIATTIQGHRRQ